MTSIQNALSSVLYSNHFCCLCLKSEELDNILYDVQDDVFFDDGNSQSLLEILAYIIGDKFIDHITTFGHICQKCAETAINSYKFIKMCNNNFSKMRKSIYSLEQFFEQKSYEINPFKSLYVCLNLRNYTTKEYQDKCVVRNQPAAFKRFLVISSANSIENSQCVSDYNVELKVELQADFIDKKPPKNIVGKNRVRVNLSDIIYDTKDMSVLKCKICQNVYPRPSNLRTHYLNVHAPKIFKCPLCHKSFGTALLLKTHKNYSHNTAVCCTECGKLFNSINALECHEKRHKLRHICQHCGKIYKTKRSFKAHMDEHCRTTENIIKPKFTCDDCGKQFSQKASVRVHIQFEHGNGKYHECVWCKKKFSSFSRLKEHTVTHTKDKRFNCEFCYGKFSTKTSLLYHTRIHTGEKPYQCEECDSRFLSASRRLVHMKSHHLPPEQECDICHKKFKLRNCLLRHRAKHFNPNSKLHQRQKSCLPKLSKKNCDT